MKYFDVNHEASLLHARTKAELASKLNEIENYGFERWFSKNLFNPAEEVDSDKKAYMHMIYNYWGHLVYSKILSTRKTQVHLAQIANNILQKITNGDQIYTTNFDTILDEYLHPHHLHGTFSLPLMKMEDIILASYPDGKHIEYAFLFGTNGYEKSSRLDNIRQFKQNRYQLDFFYNHDVDLGHLLIYGLSFGLAEFMSEEFLAKFPEHKNEYLMRSVDGHILLKLNERFQKNMLSKVTIAYYTYDDLHHLEDLLSMTDFNSVVNFRHSSEILASRVK
jgi:hypothetical protein